MSGILQYYIVNNKEILENVSFIIVEPNKGMIRKQQQKLEIYLKLGFDIMWRSLEELGERSFNIFLISVVVF